MFRTATMASLTLAALLVGHATAQNTDRRVIASAGVWVAETYGESLRASQSA